MTNLCKYTAKKPNAKGHIDYSPEENSVWETLILRQQTIVEHRACAAYLEGLHQLQMPTQRIPQCQEISDVLKKMTGWQVVPVEALIPADYFFELLSQRCFPAATFIRIREELDYLQEPDLFHEFFGHCPLLTNSAYADAMQMYGALALIANARERELLARLYWFTFEFGLLKTPQGLRIYGGGILSSKTETVSCLEDPAALRKPFTVLDALRTPFRIDIVQPLYYILDDIQQLYAFCHKGLLDQVHEADALGDFPPIYSPYPGPQEKPPQAHC